MKASNLSVLSKRSTASDFLKMDKSQMKVMMGALIKSKKQIEKADVRCADMDRPNKTMLN